MSISSPHISISITGTRTINIQFSRNSKEFYKVISKISILKLSALRENLYKGLDRFLMMIRSRDLNSPGDVSNAFKQLHSTGRELIFYLFGEDQYQVRDFFIRACPSWLKSSEANYLPPLIQIRCPSDILIPFEFLPLFNTDADFVIENTHDLVQIASRFLGFSAIVSRELYYSEIDQQRALCDGIFDNEDSLRIRFFKNQTLKDVVKEEGFLQKNEHVELLNNWPDIIVDDNTFKLEFAQQLRNGSGMGADLDRKLDHIQHLACHCNTKSAGSEEYHLFLTYWILRFE